MIGSYSARQNKLHKPYMEIISKQYRIYCSRSWVMENNASSLQCIIIDRYWCMEFCRDNKYSRPHWPTKQTVCVGRPSFSLSTLTLVPIFYIPHLECQTVARIQRYHALQIPCRIRHDRKFTALYSQFTCVPLNLNSFSVFRMIQKF